MEGEKQDALRSIDCDYVYGYLWSHYISEVSVEKLECVIFGLC
ncbi:hypothetical protein [Ruminococcus sp.]|nr:hypothetical protein [Ruminococcus sp.]